MTDADILKALSSRMCHDFSSLVSHITLSLDFDLDAESVSLLKKSSEKTTLILQGYRSILNPHGLTDPYVRKWVASFSEVFKCTCTLPENDLSVYAGSIMAAFMIFSESIRPQSSLTVHAGKELTFFIKNFSLKNIYRDFILNPEKEDKSLALLMYVKRFLEKSVQYTKNNEFFIFILV